MKTLPILGLFGAGAACVTVFMLWPADDFSPAAEAAKQRQKEPRQKDRHESIGASRDTRVALLAREVDDLRAQVQKAELDSHEQQTQEETSAPIPEKASPLSSEERQRRKVSFYSGRLESEVRDEQAAAEFEQKLEAGFAAVTHSSLDKVDCRSTMCRIEIIHVEPHARDRFHELILGSGPLKYGAFDYLDQEGSGDVRRTVAFVGMPGHPLTSSREAIASRSF